MRNLGRAVSGAALLQLAAASCCRSNQCLRAIVSPDQYGIADCSANLIVTVTPAASTFTETTTAVESAFATALFTETDTETVSTETLLYTESTTVTAYTQIIPVVEATTVAVTMTVVQTVGTVTSTSTQYQEGQTIKARETALPDLPDYASAACLSWEKYVSACKCAGVEPTTVTALAPAATTVTVAAANTASVVSTLSSTVTEVVSVTVTTSGTQTDIISLTETVTTTQTDTILSTVTTLQTTTPTAVIPLMCQPTGLSFRASMPFPDGSTRWMNVVNSAIVAWQTFSSGTTGSSLYSSTWVLDSNGYLELANKVGTATEFLVPYMYQSSAGSSVQVQVKPKPDVEAGVAAGTFVRLKGCVNAATNQVTITGNGRSNMLSCGNGLYLSTGTGSDIRSDCVQLSPTAVRV